MSENRKIVILSSVAFGILVTTLIFAWLEPALALIIPATLLAIAAIVRAIRGDNRAARTDGGQAVDHIAQDVPGPDAVTREQADPPPDAQP